MGFPKFTVLDTKTGAEAENTVNTSKLCETIKAVRFTIHQPPAQHSHRTPGGRSSYCVVCFSVVWLSALLPFLVFWAWFKAPLLLPDTVSAPPPAAAAAAAAVDHFE